MPSILEVALCLTIVAGSVFVCQPSFLFGSAPQGNRFIYLLSIQFLKYLYPVCFRSYAIGACLSIGIAALAGMFTVTSAKCKDFPTQVFMMFGGVLSLACGSAYIIAFPNPEARSFLFTKLNNNTQWSGLVLSKDK